MTLESGRCHAFVVPLAEPVSCHLRHCSFGHFSLTCVSSAVASTRIFAFPQASRGDVGLMDRDHWLFSCWVGLYNDVISND